MKAMSSHIEIGNYVFRRCNSFEVNKSRKNIVQTAVIRMPNLQKKLDSVIKVGDSVLLKAAYDEDYRVEFAGYVSEIVPKIPFEIKCEDEMWKLKQTTINKSWPSITLKDLLEYIAPGVELQVQELALTNVRLSRVSAAKALEAVRDKYFLDIYFKTVEEAGVIRTYLFAGVPYTEQNQGRVRYHFQKNLPAAQDDLTFKRASDVKIKVTAISEVKDGKDIRIHVGDEFGEENTIKFFNIKTEAELKKLAEERFKLLKYDGYRGRVRAFGRPYADVGMIEELEDDRYPEKAGSFFIDGINVLYGPDGYQRISEPGRRAS
jgi:hypothetical protein